VPRWVEHLSVLIVLLVVAVILVVLVVLVIAILLIVLVILLVLIIAVILILLIVHFFTSCHIGIVFQICGKLYIVRAKNRRNRKCCS